MRAKIAAAQRARWPSDDHEGYSREGGAPKSVIAGTEGCGPQAAIGVGAEGVGGTKKAAALR